MPACSTSASEALPDHPAGGRVEPDGGLVEEQHRGAVEQRARDLQAAEHPAGERAREPLEHRLELHRLDRLLDALAPLAPGHAGHAAVEVEVLVGGERAVDGDRLGDVADAGAHREAVAADVIAGHQRAPVGGLEQGREHADGGRLARAVGPEQAEHLAGCDREGDAADGLELTEADDEVVDEHRWSRGAAALTDACLRSPPGRRPGGRLPVGVGVELADPALARACASRTARPRAWPSSPARWRTSSSWRSMCPSASLSSSRRRVGSTSSRRSWARTSARASSAVSSVLSSSSVTPSRSLQAHHLAQALDLLVV